MDVPSTWTFQTAEIAGQFDAHVRAQLPWYPLATMLAAELVRAFLPMRGTVLDVGASTGNIGRAVHDIVAERQARLLAVDNSFAMAERYPWKDHLSVVDASLLDFSVIKPDVVVCFLCAMFIPVAARRRFFDSIKAAIPAGGVCILFEREESAGGYLGTTLQRAALKSKLAAGEDAKDILAKESSLSGIQRPLSAAEVVGFVEVFRFGDFAGRVWQAPA